MNIEQCIAERIRSNGMKIKAVSEKSGVPYSVLQPALKGRRPLKAGEFFSVCEALGINPNDFSDTSRI